MHSDFGKTITRTLPVMVAAWAALLLSFWLPGIILDSAYSGWAVAWTNTGDVMGIIVIGLALAGLLVLRAGLSWRRRLHEIAIHIVVLALLQGGGALVNEYLIKPSLAIPRPNIEMLAEDGVLGMSAQQFYHSMDQHERSVYLENILSDPTFDGIDLTPEVRDHWIDETGYSLPSGHAFSAMLFATYFLALGTHFTRSRRRWIFYVLPWWAVTVGWSRVVLWVHRPLDVVLGGVVGVVLGVLSIALAQRLMREWDAP